MGLRTDSLSCSFLFFDAWVMILSEAQCVTQLRWQLTLLSSRAVCGGCARCHLRAVDFVHFT